MKTSSFKAGSNLSQDNTSSPSYSSIAKPVEKKRVLFGHLSVLPELGIRGNQMRNRPLAGSGKVQFGMTIVPPKAPLQITHGLFTRFGGMGGVPDKELTLILRDESNDAWLNNRSQMNRGFGQIGYFLGLGLVQSVARTTVTFGIFGTLAGHGNSFSDSTRVHHFHQENEMVEIENNFRTHEKRSVEWRFAGGGGLELGIRWKIGSASLGLSSQISLEGIHRRPTRLPPVFEESIRNLGGLVSAIDHSPDSKILSGGLSFPAEIWIRLGLGLQLLF